MTTDPQPASDTLNLRITGMDCADCAIKLENGVAKLDGILECRVNFAAAKMRIEGDIDPDAVTARIQSLGYGVAADGARFTPKTRRQHIIELLRRPRNTATLIGGLFLLAGFGVQLFTTLPALPLFLIGGLFGLYFPAKSGWGALRAGQGLDMNVLMTVAAVGAFAIGEYAEAATVIVLFSLGEALEGYTMERARDSIRSLTQLAPAEALVRRPCTDCAEHLGQSLPDGSGPYNGGPCPWCGTHQTTVSVEELVVGDTIIVKPGERIPMDGQVAVGVSAVNQAPITGESVPVEKEPGSEVFAGTVNGDGLLEITVTRLAADNTLARLIYLVEEAQAQKTPTQRFVDKFAKIYTPAVVILAVLVAAVPPLLLGQPFLDTPAGHGWLYRALTLLVIACPCALVIATPVTVVSAISNAARRGVLIKGGAFLEALGRVRVVAFDKTGTLTRGRPALVGLNCADNCCADARLHNLQAVCDHCDEMLAAAAAVERYSTHPLARAIITAADDRRLPQLSAARVENLPGRGIRGQVNRRSVTLGSHALLHNPRPEYADFCRRVSGAEAGGQTAVLVQQNDTLSGYLAVSDPPRPGAAGAVAALKTAGVQKTVMLTGDNPTVARAIGQQMGMDDIRAELLPQDKVTAVRQLVAQHGNTVAMVGDGVNDAPALAAASVGIAMGAGGTAQALETADVALMADDLSQLPAAIRLGRRAASVIKFNIGLALVIKAVFLLAAVFGAANLWMAVFADVGASLIVILNGMRLLRPSHR